jgi:serine/threonine-protein kinase HipA
MPEVVVSAEIRLWGQLLGAVAETDDGSVVFEYAEEFRRRGFDLSPLHLPRTLRGPVRFDELRRKDAFRGLPGVLADVLPDAFGKQVIRAYYTARGQLDRAFSPVQHLLYVGTRGIGALEFHPPEDIPVRAAERQALEVAALVADARRIIQGDAQVAIPEIYRIGSSAGGMRPKAVVLFNEDTGEVRSAFAAPLAGDVPAILKFDGVGRATIGRELGEPEPFNRVEAAYASMAREAGLDVVDVRILEGVDGHSHLLIPRFDRPLDTPLHQHTLGGLLHVDYHDVGASSYEEYLRTTLRLGMPHAAVLEGYRRAAFNVLAVNQDDHVKNLSFHMDTDGSWRLTPAYDVTFAKGGEWTALHQMRLADKRSGITRADLLALGRSFGVRAPGRILERIQDALARWPDHARETGVPEATVAAIAAELEARRVEVEG